MKRLREHAALFIRKADDDTNLIRFVLGNAEVTDEIIGFHFQQAIEKLLKAACTIKNIRFIKTHNIRVLMDLLSENGNGLPETFASLDYLTPYGVVGRYEEMPFDFPFDRSEILPLIDELKSWVESL